MQNIALYNVYLPRMRQNLQSDYTFYLTPIFCFFMNIHLNYFQSCRSTSDRIKLIQFIKFILYTDTSMQAHTHIYTFIHTNIHTCNCLSQLSLYPWVDYDYVSGQTFESAAQWDGGVSPLGDISHSNGHILEQSSLVDTLVILCDV